jgi:hypothetical protein
VTVPDDWLSQRPPWIPALRYEELRLAAMKEALREHRRQAWRGLRALRISGILAVVVGISGVILTIWLNIGDIAIALSVALIAAGMVAMRTQAISFEEIRRHAVVRLGAALDNYRQDQLSLPDFYHSEAWQALRRTILENKEARCIRCGRKSSAMLVVEHIRSRADAPELALDPANIQILCHACRNVQAASTGTA